MASPCSHECFIPAADGTHPIELGRKSLLLNSNDLLQNHQLSNTEGHVRRCWPHLSLPRTLSTSSGTGRHGDANSIPPLHSITAFLGELPWKLRPVQLFRSLMKTYTSKVSGCLAVGLLLTSTAKIPSAAQPLTGGPALSLISADRHFGM